MVRQTQVPRSGDGKSAREAQLVGRVLPERLGDRPLRLCSDQLQLAQQGSVEQDRRARYTGERQVGRWTRSSAAD